MALLLYISWGGIIIQRDKSNTLAEVVFIFYCGVTHDYNLSGLTTIYL